MVVCFGNTSTDECPSADDNSLNLFLINFAATGSFKNKNICNPPLLDLHGMSGNFNFRMVRIIFR